MRRKVYHGVQRSQYIKMEHCCEIACASSLGATNILELGVGCEKEGVPERNACKLSLWAKSRPRACIASANRTPRKPNQSSSRFFLFSSSYPKHRLTTLSSTTTHPLSACLHHSVVVVRIIVFIPDLVFNPFSNTVVCFVDSGALGTKAPPEVRSNPETIVLTLTPLLSPFHQHVAPRSLGIYSVLSLRWPDRRNRH